MEIEKYREVQDIAKAVHDELVVFINPESTENSIAEKARELLKKYGVENTWYHGVHAFVLLGERSCLSISGKDYKPGNEKVGDTNLVTVDLSPQKYEIWGDCARSFYVEKGECKLIPHSNEFIHGKKTEESLHNLMKKFVTPNTLFSELYEFGNKKIEELGYENLDFLGNLGHSIETDKNNRKFIDVNCNEKLSNVGLFTFEPHIRKKGGKWGFKHENIYYFNSTGKAVEL